MRHDIKNWNRPVLYTTAIFNLPKYFGFCFVVLFWMATTTFANFIEGGKYFKKGTRGYKIQVFNNFMATNITLRVMNNFWRIKHTRIRTDYSKYLGPD